MKFRGAAAGGERVESIFFPYTAAAGRYIATVQLTDEAVEAAAAAPPRFRSCKWMVRSWRARRSHSSCTRRRVHARHAAFCPWLNGGDADAADRAHAMRSSTVWLCPAAFVCAIKGTRGVPAAEASLHRNRWVLVFVLVGAPAGHIPLQAASARSRCHISMSQVLAT